MTGIVIGEIPCIAAVAYNEQLHEAQQSAVVTVARLILVIDDLLHGASGADVQGLKLNLYDRDTIDE